MARRARPCMHGPPARRHAFPACRHSIATRCRDHGNPRTLFIGTSGRKPPGPEMPSPIIHVQPYDARRSMRRRPLHDRFMRHVPRQYGATPHESQTSFKTRHFFDISGPVLAIFHLAGQPRARKRNATAFGRAGRNTGSEYRRCRVLSISRGRPIRLSRARRGIRRHFARMTGIFPCSARETGAGVSRAKRGRGAACVNLSLTCLRQPGGAGSPPARIRAARHPCLARHSCLTRHPA